MAKLDISKAVEKGGQLLHNNQHYDVGMDELHSLFKGCDYAMGLSNVFCLGFCQGYKAGQKASIKKSKKTVDSEVDFYRKGIRELSEDITDINILRLSYNYIRAGWMEDRKERNKENVENKEDR